MCIYQFQNQKTPRFYFPQFLLSLISFCSTQTLPVPHSPPSLLLFISLGPLPTERHQETWRCSVFCTQVMYKTMVPRLPFFLISTLPSRRKISKLLLLYKLIHNILFIPRNILNFQDSSSSHLRFSHHLNIRIPYSWTNSSLYSFFPNTSALWNSLPSSVKDSNSPIILRNSLRHLFQVITYYLYNVIIALCTSLWLLSNLLCFYKK